METKTAQTKQIEYRMQNEASERVQAVNPACHCDENAPCRKSGICRCKILARAMDGSLKKYATMGLLALTLACPAYAGTEDYTPKSIAIKNVACKVDYYQLTDNHANLAMVVQKNGTNYLAEARIEVIRGLNQIVDGAEKKAAAIEALVNAELAKGTNGTVSINGNRDEKHKKIEMYSIQIDGHQINLGKTTQ